MSISMSMDSLLSVGGALPRGRGSITALVTWLPSFNLFGNTSASLTEVTFSVEIRSPDKIGASPLFGSAEEGTGEATAVSISGGTAVVGVRVAKAGRKEQVGSSLLWPEA
ncbi:hypothetical protein M8J76_007063 [Diaphorina citri]|nr:hypothetical protein M8J76_007063 [Diaphorina citri]